MLQLKTVTPQFADFDKLSALYHSAFPENERRPLEEMFTFLSGSGEFLALYDGETFCGFVCLLSWQDITHILYLAIDSRLRGRGYGTGMLSAIRQLSDSGLGVLMTSHNPDHAFLCCTRAVLIMDSDHVVLSALQPETVSNRFGGRAAADDAEESAL